MQPQSSTSLDPDEELVEMKGEDLETRMKQIAQSKILFDYDITALKKYGLSFDHSLAKRTDE
jgi:hypothetical protein